MAPRSSLRETPITPPQAAELPVEAIVVGEYHIEPYDGRTEEEQEIADEQEQWSILLGDPDWER